MGISTVELNKLTITHHSLTFIDLVNKSRVDYFVDIIKLNDFSVFTIEALAHKSGFGSRQNLYKSFKKFHGGTPSDLIRSIQEIS
jgi:YesN/AraC family two-component response regulator